MKKIHTLFCIFLSIGLFFSCENVLDIKPDNILDSETIFSSESGIETYMMTMYNDLPIEDYNFRPSGLANSTRITHLTDESISNLSNDKNSIGGGTSMQWWGYSQVRKVNTFLEKIQLTTSKFDQSKINSWMGEAKFIRAFYYFSMVKRYGGIPLITQTQQWTGNNLDELQVPRNSEKEIYDFIARELDEAANLLGEKQVAGRIEKYAAYGLKSRAMVYAASVAKYGTLQFEGDFMFGIPDSCANRYWLAAYEAGKKVIEGGKFSLYRLNPDKTQNFQDLFLAAQGASTNPEILFVKLFKYPDKGHNYDRDCLPFGVRSILGYGSYINPTLELVEQYEYVDGSAGKLKLKDGSGNLIKYKDPIDLFKDKDPRLAATIILPFAKWKGIPIDVQAGLINGTQTITSGSYTALYNPTTKQIDAQGTIRVIGLNGIGGGNEVSQTGFYLRKQLNPVYTPSDLGVGSRSDQQFIVLRYAEVLLNYAEAAVELNKLPDATWAMNEIRDRAGIKLLNESEVTVAKVRHERLVELAFENHRWWDIRRWRIGESVMNNTKFTALLPYKVLDDNTYVFKTTPVGYGKIFQSRFNYERIDPAEFTKNPKLFPQNPGYEF